MTLNLDRVYVPNSVSRLSSYFAWMATRAPDYPDSNGLPQTQEQVFAVARAAISEIDGLSRGTRNYLLARVEENWVFSNAGEIDELKSSFGELHHFLWWRYRPAARSRG